MLYPFLLKTVVPMSINACIKIVNLEECTLNFIEGALFCKLEILVKD